MTTLSEVIYAFGYAGGIMQDHLSRGASDSEAVRCAAISLAQNLNIQITENNKEQS